MDYTNLVKELHESPANKRLMIYAADAIEKLQQTVEQMKAIVIVEAQHTEMFDERDKKTLIEMAKSLPLQIIPYNDAKPRWISVEERLPSENTRYLTVSIEPWFGTTVVDTMRWSGVWMYDGRKTGAKVTHWMPLPEPPKEETE